MITDVISTCNLVIKHVTVGLLVALTFGCNISVPQAESSYKFVKDRILADDVLSQEQEAIWLASVGDRGAVLRPYLSGGLTVFANTDGDAIAFDGWTVRSILGFGLPDPLSISGKDGHRSFSIGGRTASTECDSWHFSGSTWTQTCTNGPGKITLNREGNIEVISMSLGENLGNVTLRVAK